VWLCNVLLSQVTTRQAQEEPATAGRSRRGHKTAQEQSTLVRDTNVEVISMMLQALEKEHRGLLYSLQGPIIAFIMDMLPVRLPGTTSGAAELQDAAFVSLACLRWFVCLRCQVIPCSSACSAVRHVSTARQPLAVCCVTCKQDQYCQTRLMGCLLLLHAVFALLGGDA
jgi:hypothetical protein